MRIQFEEFDHEVAGLGRADDLGEDFPTDIALLQILRPAEEQAGKCLLV
jgi:hypothetical protein